VLCIENEKVHIKKFLNIQERKLESKLRRDEKRKNFSDMIYEMREVIEKTKIPNQFNGPKGDEPNKLDEISLSNAFTDSSESTFKDKAIQSNEVSLSKTLTGLAKSKHKMVRFREAKARTETSDLSNSTELNNLNSTKGFTATKTKKCTLKPNKTYPIPNITAPQPGAKICFKSNLPQSQAVSLKVSNKPIWRN